MEVVVRSIDFYCYGLSKAKQPHNEEQPDDLQVDNNSKTAIFCRYSDEVLGDIQQKINMTGLEKFELYHYCWNIWNHFRIAQQPETAQ